MTTATKLTQGELFPVVPLPPCNATATSKAAAKAIDPKAGTLRALILTYLRERGRMGATDCEMQDDLGMSGDTQRPRRWELAGGSSSKWPLLIMDSGRTRTTASGRQATVWVVKPQTQGE